VQRGPTENVVVALGSRVSADLQQIWPGQSLLCWQVFGQLLLQIPSQQISPPAVLQSTDWAQTLGQAVVLLAGLRQRPVALRFGSRLRTVVQQTSPLVVSHSEDWVHAFGHLDAGKQKF
jgi:hypothetical protein